MDCNFPAICLAAVKLLPHNKSFLIFPSYFKVSFPFQSTGSPLAAPGHGERQQPPPKVPETRRESASSSPWRVWVTVQVMARVTGYVCSSPGFISESDGFAL